MTNDEGQNFYKKRWFKISLISLSLIFCTVVSCVLYIEDFKEGQVELTYSVAKQLGYTPEGHLVEYQDCWGIFNDSCGIFIHFTTNLTRDELQLLVDKVTPTKRLSGPIDGYGIFTDINLNSHRTLTADGNDGSGTKQFSLRKPLAYKWFFLDEQNRYWQISFFNLVEQPHQYKIDDQPISSNIVSVMLQTK